MKSVRIIFSVCISFICLIAHGQQVTEGSNAMLPTITQNQKGEIVLYWTEKATDNNMSLYYAVSPNNGQSFGSKVLIHKSLGMGASRLAKPKLLFKNDGSMVALFSFRSPAPVSTIASKPAENMPRPKRDTQIKYTVSKNGIDWSEPQNVDNDTTKLIRGFFDAVLLPNQEIAVSYLKDVKNSKLHEERDLRIAITQNGVFQNEQLIDAVVCDCCNTGLLVDNKGNLNVFYRDNNNDVRDISVMVSNDYGKTFNSPKNVFADGWEIKGCPHTGASSTTFGKGYLSTWYSGSTKTETGVRLVNEKGKLLKVLDKSTKNAQIASLKNEGIWAWEQIVEGKNKVNYTLIKNETIGSNQIVSESEASQNAAVFINKNCKLLAYELVDNNKKSTIKVVKL